jgi:hypothetical protein
LRWQALLNFIFNPILQVFINSFPDFFNNIGIALEEFWVLTNVQLARVSRF